MLCKSNSLDIMKLMVLVCLTCKLSSSITLLFGHRHLNLQIAQLCHTCCILCILYNNIIQRIKKCDITEQSVYGYGILWLVSMCLCCSQSINNSFSNTRNKPIQSKIPKPNNTNELGKGGRKKLRYP